MLTNKQAIQVLEMVIAGLAAPSITMPEQSESIQLSIEALHMGIEALKKQDNSSGIILPR